MKNNKVRELMTKDPVFISPDANLQEAAEKMEREDCGVLPVGGSNQLQGIITDRDIVIRAISKGKDPQKEKVENYMSEEAFACKEDDELKDAADLMRQYKVNRLMVENESGQIVGILTLGCILRNAGNAEEIVDVIEHARGRSYAA